jgi:hypothetical protein
MANNVEIKRTVLSIDEFNRVINKDFTTFVQPSTGTDTDTIEELFRLYDKFYFEIDLRGETNSHEYLIRRSSELVQLEQTSEDIQPLLDEIAQLREQNLQLNEQLINLESEAG